MITWVLYLCIGIIIGGMAGFYFAKLGDFSKKQKQELEDKLQKSERELVEYKDQVTTHFRETAGLINNMTESYQKVHEHLARGSYELCNNAIEVNKLTVSSNQLLSPSSHQVSTEKMSVTNKATSLAESEAPKDSKERSAKNNNNAGNSDQKNAAENKVVDVVDIKESEEVEPNIRESVAKSVTQEPLTSGSTGSTNQSKMPQQSENPVPETVVTETVAIENMVTETMAVAEEDTDDSSEQNETSKSRLPGSRMVH